MVPWHHLASKLSAARDWRRRVREGPLVHPSETGTQPPTGELRPLGPEGQERSDATPGHLAPSPQRPSMAEMLKQVGEANRLVMVLEGYRLSSDTVAQADRSLQKQKLDLRPRLGGDRLCGMWPPPTGGRHMPYSQPPPIELPGRPAARHAPGARRRASGTGRDDPPVAPHEEATELLPPAAQNRGHRTTVGGGACIVLSSVHHRFREARQFQLGCRPPSSTGLGGEGDQRHGSPPRARTVIPPLGGLSAGHRGALGVRPPLVGGVGVVADVRHYDIVVRRAGVGPPLARTSATTCLERSALTGPNS